MNVKTERIKFDKQFVKKQSELLKFDLKGCFYGQDVYNTSVPFYFNGEQYLFGRVEKREEWANSVSVLFKRTVDGVWSMVEDAKTYPLEDPFICRLNGEFVLGGTHVVMERGSIKTYRCYFYRGNDVFNLKYFTTGPDYMKDIRLFQMPEGKIGVLSRPRGGQTMDKYGTETVVGFTVVNDLNELSSEVIENAPIIDGMFLKGDWGGCNQAFYLDSGYIGLIGHQCYNPNEKSDDVTYVNTSYVMNGRSREVIDKKIIATRNSYPDGDYKMKTLKDVAFTSGIISDEKDNGSVFLYSGLGDCSEGVTKIDYPFKEYGKAKFAEKGNI